MEHDEEPQWLSLWSTLRRESGSSNERRPAFPASSSPGVHRAPTMMHRALTELSRSLTDSERDIASRSNSVSDRQNRRSQLSFLEVFPSAAPLSSSQREHEEEKEDNGSQKDAVEAAQDSLSPRGLLYDEKVELDDSLDLTKLIANLIFSKTIIPSTNKMQGKLFKNCFAGKVSRSLLSC